MRADQCRSVEAVRSDPRPGDTKTFHNGRVYTVTQTCIIRDPVYDLVEVVDSFKGVERLHHLPLVLWGFYSTGVTPSPVWATVATDRQPPDAQFNPWLGDRFIRRQGDAWEVYRICDRDLSANNLRVEVCWGARGEQRAWWSLRAWTAAQDGVWMPESGIVAVALTHSDTRVVGVVAS